MGRVSAGEVRVIPYRHTRSECFLALEKFSGGGKGCCCTAATAAVESYFGGACDGSVFVLK